MRWVFLLIFFFSSLSVLFAQDINHDGVINFADRDSIYAHLGDSLTGEIDITGDGRIDGRDIFVWSKHYLDSLFLSFPANDSLRIRLNQISSATDTLQIDTSSTGFPTKGAATPLAIIPNPTSLDSTFSAFFATVSMYVRISFNDSLYTFQGWAKGICDSIYVGDVRPPREGSLLVSGVNYDSARTQITGLLESDPDYANALTMVRYDFDTYPVDTTIGTLAYGWIPYVNKDTTIYISGLTEVSTLVYFSMWHKDSLGNLSDRVTGTASIPHCRDTSPPDTFDTPPQLVFSIPDTLTISWKPSEIDSTDIDTLEFTFDFMDDSSVSPTSLKIPWSTALVDSDTVVVFSNLNYDYVNGAFIQYAIPSDESILDTNDVCSVVTIVSDSNDNSDSMDVLQKEFYVYKENAIGVDSVWFSLNYDSVFARFNPSKFTSRNTWFNPDSIDFHIGVIRSSPGGAQGGDNWNNLENILTLAELKADSIVGRTQPFDDGDSVFFRYYIMLENSVTYKSEIFSSDTIIVPDITPPATGSFAVSGVNYDSVNIVVSGIQDPDPDVASAKSMVRYDFGAYPADTSSGYLLYGWVSYANIDTTIFISGLTEDTYIYFKLFHKDSLANVSSASDATTIPHYTGDTTPPSAPSTFIVSGRQTGKKDTVLVQASGFPGGDQDSLLIIYKAGLTYPQNRTDGDTLYAGTDTTAIDSDYFRIDTPSDQLYAFSLFMSDTTGNWQDSIQIATDTTYVDSTGEAGPTGVDPLFAIDFEKGVIADYYAVGSDSVGELKGSADISSLYTSNGDSALMCPDDGDFSRIKFDISNFDNFKSDSGFMEFKFYISDTVDYATTLFRYAGAAGGEIMYFIIYNDGNRLDWADGTTSINLNTTDSGNAVQVGAWYTLRVWWNVYKDSLGFSIVGLDSTTLVDSLLYAWANSPTSLEFGAYGGAMDSLFVDEFKIWADDDRGGVGGGALVPDAIASFSATSPSAGKMRLQGSAVDDSFVVRGNIGYYPADRNSGTLLLTGTMATFDSTIDIYNAGTWYVRAWNDSAGYWSNYVQASVAVSALYPDALTSFTATADSDSVFISYAGADDSVTVRYSGAGYPGNKSSGSFLFTSKSTSLDTTVALLEYGIQYFSAFNDSAGYTSQASQDTAQFPIADSIFTYTTARPRVFVTSATLDSIANYVTNYDSTDFQTWIDYFDNTVWGRDFTSIARGQVLGSIQSLSFLSLAKASGKFSNFTFGHTAQEYTNEAYRYYVYVDSMIKSRTWAEAVHAGAGLHDSEGNLITLTLSMFYDWSHDYLTLAQKKQIHEALDTLWTYRSTDAYPNTGLKMGNGNSLTHPLLAGMATYGDTLGSPYDSITAVWADTLDDMVRRRLYEMTELLYEDTTAGHPEAYGYAYSAFPSYTWETSALQTALIGSKDLVNSYDWLYRLGIYQWFLLHPWPMRDGEYSVQYWGVRYGDVSQMPWQLDQRRLSHWLIYNLKNTHPNLAGFYKWLYDSSQYAFDDVGVETIESQYKECYWLPYKFFWGIKDVQAKDPTTAGIKKWQRVAVGHEIHRTSFDTTAMAFHYFATKLAAPLHYNPLWGHWEVLYQGLIFPSIMKCSKNGFDLAKAYDFTGRLGYTGSMYWDTVDSTLTPHNGTTDSRDDPDDPVWQDGGQNHVGNVLATLHSDSFSVYYYDATRNHKGATGVVDSSLDRIVFLPNFKGVDTDENFVFVHSYLDLNATNDYERLYAINFQDKPTIVGSSWNHVSTYLDSANTDSGRVMFMKHTYANSNGGVYLNILRPRYALYKMLGGDTLWHRYYNDKSAYQAIGTYDDWSAHWEGKYSLYIVDSANVDTDTSHWVLVAQIGDSALTQRTVTTLESDSTIGAFIDGSYYDIVVNVPKLALVDSMGYSISTTDTVFHVLFGLKPGTYNVKDDGVSIGSYVVKSQCISFYYKGDGLITAIKQ